MRRLSLALCLPALLLAAPATGWASSEADPAPLDEVVPHGIDGLSEDEIFRLALEAAEAEDYARTVELMAAAARRGHRGAAIALVRLYFKAGDPGWARTALETLLPLADRERADEAVFFSSFGSPMPAKLSTRLCQRNRLSFGTSWLHGEPTLDVPDVVFVLVLPVQRVRHQRHQLALDVDRTRVFGHAFGRQIASVRLGRFGQDPRLPVSA
jgi:hypothetical protein